MGEYVPHTETTTVSREHLRKFLIRDTKKCSHTQQIQKVNQFERKQNAPPTKMIDNDRLRIPLLVTKSRELPNLKYILTENWYILQVNQSSRKPLARFEKIRWTGTNY